MYELSTLIIRVTGIRVPRVSRNLGKDCTWKRAMERSVLYKVAMDGRF